MEHQIVFGMALDGKGGAADADALRNGFDGAVDVSLPAGGFKRLRVEAWGIRSLRHT
jgi:hypothetical protein